jgi:putative hemolysin
MWPDLILIFVFILINGFFAAAEIAVVTLRRTRIRQMVEDGTKNARLLDSLREEPDKFLATIQIGVTLAVALASAISGALAVLLIKPLLEQVPVYAIAASSDAISIALAAVLITYFSIVLGELIPKSIAFSRPETVGLFVAPIVSRFSWVASPFVRILTVSTNLLLKPFGKRAFSERGYISEEEIKILIEEGKDRGIFEAAEKELIHSVFSFTDISVREVMVPSPQMVTIGINMPLEEVKTVILDEQFSRYPVTGRDMNDIRGILYAKDFFNMLLQKDKLALRKIIKVPLYVPETMKISFLLKDMQRKRIHMAIVIDEYGAVAGLVTLEDLIEEIIGEIRDEFDVESPVIPLRDGALLIDASISIRDLHEDHEIEIPESPEYETLGGFIVTHLQRIPQQGDEISLDGKRLRIVELVGRRISKVRLEDAVTVPGKE